MSNIVEEINLMEKIYIKYSKKLYKYLYSLTKNHSIAEELMQETFYSALKSIDTFRGECNILSWLCEIAKNKWINYNLKNNRVQFVEWNDNAMEHWLINENLEEIVLQKDELIELYKKIDKLDEKTRNVVYLRINSDLQFREIGEILNESEVWARVTFYRAKLKLKEELKNEQRL